jgi:hypothetical protein
MPESIRLDIDDAFVADISCAVCSAPELRVYHIPNYADYVSCEACESSFLVEEDGERVLYGKISEEYSDTGKVVLKNWVTLSVVARLASAERERKAIKAAEVPNAVSAPTDAVQTTASSAPTVEVSRESLREMLPQEGVAEAQQEHVALPLTEEAEEPLPSAEEPPPSAASPRPRAEEPPPSAESPPPSAESPAVITEPVPGKRYRVRIKQDAIYVPKSACASCFNSPASKIMTVSGSLPVGDSPVRWRKANFRLPLCAECQRKSTALSGAQKNTRLQVHLTAMLVGLGLLVAALGLGVVDLSGNMPVGLLLLAVIGATGYLLPLGLLLPRVRRAPPLWEAYIVETTLHVRKPEGEIAESYFEFRNADYAQLFWESNPHSVEAQVEEFEIQTELPTPEE